MNIAVVTTFNNTLLLKYAHKFLETYNWKFPLFVYSEDTLDNCKDGHCISKVFNTFDKIPECKLFVERNKNKPKPKGYIHDSTRFCYKVFAYTDWIINESKGYDGVICIDADSAFYKSCDHKWIKEHIHRDNCMMSYLGRGSMYSECGYLYFNLNHRETLNYAKEMYHWYTTDKLFWLSEWHDSFVWDFIRKDFEKRLNIKNHNIGDSGNGHVQARSCLSELYDHCKGARKNAMISPERNL